MSISLQRSKNEWLSINSPFSFSKFIKYKTQNLMKWTDTVSLSGNEKKKCQVACGKKENLAKAEGLLLRQWKEKVKINGERINRMHEQHLFLYKKRPESSFLKLKKQVKTSARLKRTSLVGDELAMISSEELGLMSPQPAVLTLETSAKLNWLRVRWTEQGSVSRTCGCASRPVHCRSWSSMTSSSWFPELSQTSTTF